MAKKPTSNLNYDLKFMKKWKFTSKNTYYKSRKNDLHFRVIEKKCIIFSTRTAQFVKFMIDAPNQATISKIYKSSYLIAKKFILFVVPCIILHNNPSRLQQKTIINAQNIIICSDSTPYKNFNEFIHCNIILTSHILRHVH